MSARSPYISVFLRAPIDESILGGAERVKVRPRGFISWNPQPKTRALLDQVRAILVEYADYLPLTLRQIFYRLVGAYDYEKTEKAYERLGEMVNRARRARLISMDAIRDDGGVTQGGGGYDSPEDFLETMQDRAASYRRDRTKGQARKLMVFCEAAGMVPQLADVANDYGIPVISSGGFDSVTEKHGLAERISWNGRPVEVLHIGDYDPSGVHTALNLAEDVGAFVEVLGGEAEFTRLAVTPEQIEPQTGRFPRGRLPAPRQGLT
jgi:hypothetical protein